jgi:triacylglycerol esterase/lipase EstA (alpha/beta hydrolase family)
MRGGLLENKTACLGLRQRALRLDAVLRSILLEVAQARVIGSDQAASAALQEIARITEATGRVPGRRPLPRATDRRLVRIAALWPLVVPHGGGQLDAAFAPIPARAQVRRLRRLPWLRIEAWALGLIFAASAVHTLWMWIG